MANVAEKSDVQSWETVATYVATYPSDDGDGAVDVEVQIGGVDVYTVLQTGQVVGEYTNREDAQAEADEANAEADSELGYEVMGDGAASVGTREVWFVRTTDDAGGSDDADGTTYADRDAAEDAAKDLAWDRDEANPDEDAEDYLRRKMEEVAGEPDSDGPWCVYWETALDDAGPRERYATEAQAKAAAKLANDDLSAANPGGNLLCGFSVRELVDGVWTASEEG